MRTRTKSALIALLTTVALALALAATTASARSISTSEREFEILFAGGHGGGPLTFEAAGNNITCPITMLGHFLERTIPKAGQVAVIRHVEPTNSAAPPCTGGEITILNETLPWRVNYVSFTGTLPAIRTIRDSLIGISFRVRGSFGNCLAGTTALKPAFGEQLLGAGGGVTGLRIDETVGIPLGGGFICEIAGESHYRGTGSVLNLPGNASITVFLI